MNKEKTVFVEGVGEVPISTKKLSAASAKEIPKELVNLTYLYADSAKEIPKELVNLECLYANSAKNVKGIEHSFTIN